VLSRLDNLANSGATTVYAEYTYLGAGTIAKVAHPAVSGGLNLVYDPDGDDSFDGLDRGVYPPSFGRGRVVDQRWQNSTPTVKDQFKYGYDRASNRTWREVAPNGGNPTGFDEFYTYDGLDRLSRSQRGTLSGTPYDSITSPVKTQDFGLEALGNWKTFKEDDDATLDWDVLDQSRTHNPVNETTGITGGSWIVPGYDAAGNMTSGPSPLDPTVRRHYKWDAWNRLVEVKADNNGSPGALVAEYRYDALNRRIAKIVPNGENWDRTDYYYTPAGQVAEERFAANQANKETLAVPRKFQYVWDIRYIHAAVLRDEDTDADNDCTDSGGSERLYYTQDANFNVTALVETDGDVIERYVYDPYGKRTILDGTWTELSWANSKKNEILFTGHRLDNESGLYCCGERYYHPTLGGWIGREQIPYTESASLYLYVNGRPCVMVDPDGQQGILTSLGGRALQALQGAWEAASNWIEQNVGNSPEMAAAGFAVGGGPNAYYFKPGDAFLEIVRNDPYMDEVRERVREFLQARCEYPACDATPTSEPIKLPHEYTDKGIIGDLELVRDYAYAGLQFAPVPSMGLQALGATKASAYLGTYNVELKAENIKCCLGKAKIVFHVWDFWNAETASNVPFIGPRLPNSPFGESGPIGGTTWLYFDWEEEDFEFRGDSRCVDE